MWAHREGWTRMPYLLPSTAWRGQQGCQTQYRYWWTGHNHWQMHHSNPNRWERRSRLLDQCSPQLWGTCPVSWSSTHRHRVTVNQSEAVVWVPPYFHCTSSYTLACVGMSSYPMFVTPCNPNHISSCLRQQLSHEGLYHHLRATDQTPVHATEPGRRGTASGIWIPFYYFI